MLTVDQRTEIDRHVDSPWYPGRCTMCGMEWPCIIATLAEEVADLKAALAVETNIAREIAQVARRLERTWTALGAPYDSDAKAEQP